MQRHVTPAGALWPPLYAILNLPGGMNGGFVGVTLGYVLTHHGFSVAAIAGLVSLHLLPTTWRFVMGPAVDLSLTPRRWFVLSSLALALGAAAFAFVPLRATAFPLLAALALATGIASNAATVASMTAMALTSPPEQRGAVAGWVNVGSLGGTGLGGGAGLWLVSHAGGLPVAALALAAVSLLSILPILWLRTPVRPPSGAVSAELAELGRFLWRFVRTRSGVLAIVAVTIPAALNASGALFPAVAGDWKASADLVALVTGALSGLISMPGCVFGGYICDRFTARKVYIWAAFGCALCQFAMALSPHTPGAFAGFILVTALVQGIAFGALSAVIFECLGATAAATLGTVLGSLCNVPVVLGVWLVGVVQTRHGSNAMLLAEGSLALAVLAAYTLLAWFWKPAPARLDPTLQVA